MVLTFQYGFVASGDGYVDPDRRRVLVGGVEEVEEVLGASRGDRVVGLGEGTDVLLADHLTQNQKD